MVFESVRGYVELMSGLSELTRARALDAAHGLLSLPAVGIATSSKVAAQAGALADELMTAAATNRSNLRSLVRSEVEVAITALGLVPAQKLEQARAEAARLRAEVVILRSASSTTAAPPSAPRQTAAPKKATGKKATAKKATARKATAKKATAKKATAKRATATKAATAKAAAKRAPAPTGAGPKSVAKKSAVTTRIKPAGT